MSQTTCTLCGLPTPDPPITDPDIEGIFCCEGCLQVADILSDLDPEQAEQVRKETIARKHQEWEEQTDEPPASCSETFLKVDGMYCSTCEAFVESMLKQQPGIYKSEASYASELVKIYYDSERITQDELPDYISKMGYTAYPMDSLFGSDNFTKMIRLSLGAIFAVYGLLVYILVLYPVYLTGHEVIPFSSTAKYFFISNLVMMTSVVLFFTGWPILRGAWVSASVLKPNMNLLVAIAALSAYLFSIVALFMGVNELYFDVTMTIIVVVTFGNYYESRVKNEKNSLLEELMEKQIQQARVRRDGTTAMVDLENLQPRDEIIIKAGERIPVDGTVVDGQGVVNEALITGESLPVVKEPGDRALSGTVLTQNMLILETDEQVESTIENMIHLMWDIQASRSGKQRLANRIASFFVPGVLLLGVLTFTFYLLTGAAISNALLSALAVLIVSCPCALGLATPLAVASGLRDALANNIIFKSGSVFEEQSDADILAFDKTGTLTNGRMRLLDEGENHRALRYAAAIEQYSSHPVAKAIAEAQGNWELEVKAFKSESQGVQAMIADTKVFIGQPDWLIENGFSLTDTQQNRITQARENGHIPTGVAWNGQVKEILIVGDQIREEAQAFIASLKERGKKIAIITGDSEQAARPIRDILQPDYLFTEARPESKTAIINKLKKSGSVAMIGDGSNDALALADADLGIAFGDLTAIAAESAQVVIPGDNLYKITAAINAMDQTKARIRQNLGWAFLYNAIAIPLAVAGLINPLFAALAMAGSSLLVVINSSRTIKL